MDVFSGSYPNLELSMRDQSEWRGNTATKYMSSSCMDGGREGEVVGEDGKGKRWWREMVGERERL